MLTHEETREAAIAVHLLVKKAIDTAVLERGVIRDGVEIVCEVEEWDYSCDGKRHTASINLYRKEGRYFVDAALIVPCGSRIEAEERVARYQRWLEAAR